jgi:hypothetical protein
MKIILRLHEASLKILARDMQQAYFDSLSLTQGQNKLECLSLAII